MTQVFTSYSRRDTEVVDTIVGKMSQAGITVWIDREAIKAGNTWRVQIVQAIDTCNAFVLMLSPNSAASDNVRKEIDLAQDSGRTIHWGDRAGNDTKEVVTADAPLIVPIYGEIPGGQRVREGTYSDVITVSVTY